MGKDTLVQVYVNPLVFFEMDEPFAQLMGGTVDASAILKYLLNHTGSLDLEQIATRYREVSGEKTRLFAAPAEKKILEKLVRPLRHAKGSYMIANYLGTISLCGMVAEMVSILLFEITPFNVDGASVNGRDLTEEQQRRLWKSAYERMGQQQRAQTLHTEGVIDEIVKNNLDMIRDTRRRYLHFFSQDHSALQRDAARVYIATLAIAVSVIGQEIHQGKIRFNSRLIEYLEEHDLVEPVE